MNVEQEIAELRGRVAVLEELAKPVDISGEYGDKVVAKDPSKWTGETMVGKKWSECPAAYLDMLASLCDWKAGKNDEEFAATGDEKKKKYAGYERADARKIREHAKRAAARPVIEDEEGPPF